MQVRLPNTAMKWLCEVERLALRAVAPRTAARRLPTPGVGSDSNRPLLCGRSGRSATTPTTKWARHRSVRTSLSAQPATSPACV